jgi:hypothetical protein
MHLSFQNKMKQISARDPAQEFNQRFLQQFQDLLVEHLNLKRFELSTIEKCISEYTSFEDILHAMTQMVVDQKNFTKVNQMMKKM